MPTLKYSLDDFVHDMESLLACQPQEQRIFDTGSSWLEKLISNPGAIPSQFRVPAAKGRRPNHGTYILYQGESGLSVTAVVWGAGEHVGPHDHRTWGMIGVMDNLLTETRFQRVDDRSREGYARLEQDRQATLKPGEITLLIPDGDEIHQMDNFTDRPTAEIHVYGTDLRGVSRSRYDLETGKIITFKSTKYDNC
jgi:predicted metal-dependent enzyme (double-stranded beta helix superfamily)